MRSPKWVCSEAVDRRNRLTTSSRFSKSIAETELVPSEND